MKIYNVDLMAMGADLDPNVFRPIPDGILEGTKEEASDGA